jgi:hypothetical protein
MSAASLLSRLQGVRQHGTGWRADCPNGHSKSRGSLSITEADDGRVMLHCFACNDTPSILRALSLEMADLFPERIKDPSPDARKAAAEAFKRNAWGAALGILDREATVVLIASNDVYNGKVLAPDDVNRVALAAQRIAQARAVLT